jgi:hypothetical protein
MTRDYSTSVKGERFGYRRNWRGKLILRVEELIPFRYDPVLDPKPAGYIKRWRDACLADLPYPWLGER